MHCCNLGMAIGMTLQGTYLFLFLFCLIVVHKKSGRFMLFITGLSLISVLNKVYFFKCRQVGPQRTSIECRQHFEKYFIENWGGNFDFSSDEKKLSDKSLLRLHEPLACSARTQEISGAPLGRPIRPLPGSVVFKGKSNKVCTMIYEMPSRIAIIPSDYYILVVFCFRIGRV